MCRFVLLVVFLLPACAFAEGLKIEPGQWQFTIVTPNPRGGPPDRRISNDCLREGEMKPQFFTAGMQGCTVADTHADESWMTWTMECPSSAGRATGKGSLRSSGTTISGWVEVLMKVNGANYSSKSSWEGRRTGICN
jgi:hypothetical protein